MATIIKTSGETVEISKPTLEDLQKAVGGYIEAVTLPNGKVMVVNEEGLLNDLPINLVGCGLFPSATPIVGDIVICTVAEMNGEE